MENGALQELLDLAKKDLDGALKQAERFDVSGIGEDDKERLIQMQNNSVSGKVVAELLASIYFPNR